MRVRWIIVAVAIVGAMLAMFEWLLPYMVTRLAQDAAVAAGFPDAVVRGVRVRLDHTTIGEIALDAEGRNRIGPIRIDYRVADLRQRRVRAITLDGASLDVTITADGAIGIAGTPLSPRGGGSEGLPFDRLDVIATSLIVATPQGPIDVDIRDGRIEPGDGAVAVTGRVRLTHAFGDATTSVTAVAGDGGVTARFEDVRAAIAHALVTVPTLTGRAEFRMAADGTVAARADLDAPALTLGDAGFADGALALTSDGRSVAATVHATGPGGAILDVEGSMPLAGVAAMTSPLAGDTAMTARLAIKVPDLAALGSRARGAVMVVADLTGSPPVQGGSWAAKGTVTASLTDGAVPGLAEGIAVAAAGTIAADPDRLEIAATAPWSVTGTLAEDLVPPRFAALLEGKLELALTPSRLVASRGAAGWTVDVAGPFAILRDGAVAIDGNAGALALTVNPDGQPTDFRIDGLTVAAGALEIAGSTVSDATLALDAKGSPLAWTGSVDAAATIAAPLPDGVTADPVRLAGAADLAFADGGLALGGRDCLDASTADISAHGFAVPGPVALCLRAVTVAVDGSGWSLHAAVDPFAIAGTLAGEEPVPVTARIASVALDLDADTAQATIAGSTIALPDLGIALDGAGGTLVLNAAGPGTLNLAGRIVQGGTPAWFAPLGLTLRADLPQGAPIALTATIDDPTGALAIDVTATHDTGLGAGHADLELFPVTFVPGLRPPDRLFPILRGLVEDAAGTVAVDGHAAWSRAGLIGGATVLLDGLSALIGPARVEALNGVLTLDRLWPPSLPPGQRVSIGLIDVGVPLTDGVVDFWMAPNGRVAVDRAEWNWAGGVVGAEPFTARLDDPEWRIALAARDLDLAQILTLIDIGGLTGTGTLAGRLPLRLSLDTIAVEDGLLAATGPGVLNYVPSIEGNVLGAGQGGTEVLLDALKNFQYEKLVLSINGVAGGETALGLRVEGRNPDLYDGYPVALNVNLSGALDTILRRGLVGYRIPDQVREQLEGFGKEQP